MNRSLLVALLIAALLAAWSQVEPMTVPRPNLWRMGAALALVLAYALWLIHRRRASSGEVQPEPEHGGWLIAYASQTGTASEIACRNAERLRAAQVPVCLLDLGQVDAAVLSGHRHALFLIATTGEGDPPESAHRFVRTAMRADLDLSGLDYALLALGDREYPQFCGFGRDLQVWLRRCGAQPRADSIEVDAGDPAALARWEAQLSTWFAPMPIPSPRYQRWRLQTRRCLNPGSQGGAIYLLRLQPERAEALDWQAGAIASVRIRHSEDTVSEWLNNWGTVGLCADEVHRLRTQLVGSRLLDPHTLRGATVEQVIESLRPLPDRDYSIASIAEDGLLDLVVREQRGPDGRPGPGSAWLCKAMVIGDTLELHIRANQSFAEPEGDVPLILIGNGTGIAGLRALLRARLQRGRQRNWLLYGERQPGIDDLFDDELQACLAAGGLQRLDRVYSRLGDGTRYVQDRLHQCQTVLRDWLRQGAHLRVCGSAASMGAAVDHMLRALLGDAEVERLIEAGRYRCDVY